MNYELNKLNNLDTNVEANDTPKLWEKPTLKTLDMGDAQAGATFSSSDAGTFLS